MNWIGFTHPWLLAAAAAVSFPVVIHFLTRARPRRIAFPPFQFLLEACAGRQAVHRLRTIVLLTIRSLALLALVLLFTRPFLKPLSAGGEGDARGRIVLVLDASLSMRAVQRGMPLFSRAQAEAAEVLRGLETGSEADVILAGAAPRALLPALSKNLPALHDELVKSQPTFECGDPAAALALAQRILNGHGTIYVFSDFQKSNWQSVRELPAGILCRLRSVAAEAVDNAAITALRVAPTEPVAGEAAEIICTVFNCGLHAREETVRLELDDFAGDKRIEVPAFGTAQAVFNLTFPRAGVFGGQASLSPDDLREDNVRYIAVRVHPAIQILLVSDSDISDVRSAAHFVSRAIVPNPQAAPGFRLVRRHSQDADRGILETADAFALVSPAVLTGESVEIIARRVQAGAPLLVFFDGPTSPALMPATFGPPFRLVRSVTSSDGESVAAGPRALFADAEAADWSSLRFHRHYQTQLLDGHREDVMLSYPDGSTALAMTASGKGAVVYANVPLTTDGSNLAGSPMFPAAVHELLRVLRRGVEEQAVTPGSLWTLEVPTRGDTPLKLIGPGNKPIAAQVVSSGRTTRLAVPAVPEPGIYWAKQGDEFAAAGVVNIDARESDTRPMALESLKAGAGAAITVVRDEGELSIAGKVRPMWPYLAAALAAFLAIEMALLAAWRRNPATA